MRRISQINRPGRVKTKGGVIKTQEEKNLFAILEMNRRLSDIILPLDDYEQRLERNGDLEYLPSPPVIQKVVSGNNFDSLHLSLASLRHCTALDQKNLEMKISGKFFEF